MDHLASFTSAAGRVINLTALHVQATYAGHLEGAHTPFTNNRKPSAIPKRAQRLLGGPDPVLVIDPPRRKGTVLPGLTYEGGPVHRETRPPVACMARCSSGPVPGADGAFSSLIVAWFQEAMSPAPHSVLAQHLQTISWDEGAHTWWP